MSNAIEVPHGDVTASLNFYAPPVDNSDPYFIISRENSEEAQFNYSDNNTDVIIHDVRGREAEFTLDRDAFQIITEVLPSKEIDFTSDENIKTIYYPEIQQLLSEHIPGKNRILVYDHTVRRQSSGAQYSPLTRVHIDHTANSVARRVRQYLPTEADQILQARYRIINVWRPLNKQPLESYPLAFASVSTFDDRDIVPVEHRYKDGSLVREVALIKHNPTQKWYYLSGMTDRERLLLECFDSESLRAHSMIGGKTPHAAFKDPRTREEAEGRESIEVRSIVFSYV